MARTLTLNGKEYNIDELSDDAKKIANNIVFAESKLNQLQNEAAIVQTARNAYIQVLSNMLENPKQAPEKADS
jgi:hypothetical protein